VPLRSPSCEDLSFFEAFYVCCINFNLFGKYDTQDMTADGAGGSEWLKNIEQFQIPLNLSNLHNSLHHLTASFY
jgi:hypothetical protein